MLLVPSEVAVDLLAEDRLPAGWDQANLQAARALHGAWLRERRSAVLVVQSVVVRREGHVLLNPQHPDLHRITSTAPEPVLWDARLFGRH